MSPFPFYNPEPLGRLIGRAYLEAVDSLDASSEYIGRLTMEIIERELNRMPSGRKSRPLVTPSIPILDTRE